MLLHPVTPNLSIEAHGHPPYLSSDLQAKVDALWEAEVRRRGTAVYDGCIFSVKDRTPDRITGVVVQYRLFAAQQRCPELFHTLEVRPLAVSGIVESPDGFIFGRRSDELAAAPGQWELAPSGGIDPEVCLFDQVVNYLRQFEIELEEETGIGASLVAGATPVVLVEDQDTHVIDLVIAANTRLLSPEIQHAFSTATREYSELRVVATPAIPSFLAEHPLDMTSTTTPILRYQGIEV